MKTHLYEVNCHITLKGAYFRGGFALQSASILGEKEYKKFKKSKIFYDWIGKIGIYKEDIIEKNFTFKKIG